MSTAHSALPVLLRHYPRAVVEYVAKRGLKLAPLVDKSASYLETSETLKGAAVEGKLTLEQQHYIEQCAAGMFVLKDNAIYIKVPTVVVLTHEFAHALDYSMRPEGSTWYSKDNPIIQACYLDALSRGPGGFITTYASTNIMEFWAECVRAFVRADIPTRYKTRKVTPELLKEYHPEMYAHIEGVFLDIERAS